MQVRVANKSDLLDIARCHQKAFPSALASQMGKGYLQKMFGWYLSSGHTFLLCIRSESMVIGYCGGMIVDGTLLHGSTSSMAQYTFNAAVISILLRPWLIFHGGFLSRYKLVARNVSTRLRAIGSGHKPRSASAQVEPHAGLVVIGVDPDFQGKGYGSQLLREFENTARAKGMMRLQLTVRSGNQSALKSYLRNGWSVKDVAGVSTIMQKTLR